MDEEETILEALRHIDIDTSFREIKPNKKLLPIPKVDFKYEEKEIENIDELLYGVYQKELENRLSGVKSQKLIAISKKLKKLNEVYNSLDNEEELLERAEEASLKANLILANLYSIKPYDKEITLKDFEGNEIKITLPTNAKSVSGSANIFFDRGREQTV